MIDKSVPFCSLFLCKNDPETYPRYNLPEGYSFSFYQKGDEVAWAELECSLGQFATVEEGVKCFHDEFTEGQTLKPEDRMLFVRDAAGKAVATASLWNGMFLGKECQRVHWVAVSDACAGKGIAKALISRVLDLYNELGYKNFIYLLTATRYYPAIGIYRHFGFSEYRGPVSPEKKYSDEEFCKKTEVGIAIVNEKLQEYKTRKAQSK